MSTNTEESKKMTETLDEILKLQEELQTRIGNSNHNLETKFENIREFVTRAHAYVPILNQLSKDMVEICERTQALKRKASRLEAEVLNDSSGSTATTTTTTTTTSRQ